MDHSIPSEAAPLTPAPALGPVEPRAREPILDVLRGFAVFGILLVNVEFMRGSTLWALMAEHPVDLAWIDRAVHHAVGWLVAGKFMASFAILFGVGAAIMAGRALDAGRSPRGLLARRYGWLLAIGLAHMILLFPGDVLFSYGIAGLVLLLFVSARPRVVLGWGVGILTALLVVTAGFTALFAVFTPPQPMDADPGVFGDWMETLRAATVAAYTEGSYGQVIAVHAWQALLIQGATLFLLPWTLSLFLIGFAIGRAGVATRIAAHRPLLVRGAVVGLGIGLPLNYLLGIVGPGWIMADMQAEVGWIDVALSVAQIVGVPLLALGYLSGIALLCLRWRPVERLAKVGRMSLSAYLLQSALALIVFAGLGLYDRLPPSQALLVVAGIWAALLLFCPWWMERFRFGPAEWLWRSLTYGSRQSMRRADPAG